MSVGATWWPVYSRSTQASARCSTPSAPLSMSRGCSVTHSRCQRDGGQRSRTATRTSPRRPHDLPRRAQRDRERHSAAPHPHHRFHSVQRSRSRRAATMAPPVPLAPLALPVPLPPLALATGLQRRRRNNSIDPQARAALLPCDKLTIPQAAVPYGPGQRHRRESPEGSSARTRCCASLAGHERPRPQ